MYCEFCGSFISPYPSDGTCPNCGGKLPPPPVTPSQPAAQPVTVVVQPVIQQPATLPQIVLEPGVNCCSRCRSLNIVAKRRGYRWWLAILGVCCLSAFGFLLGFIGSRRLRYRCNTCGNKWKAPRRAAGGKANT